jgi:hypothetical protein
MAGSIGVRASAQPPNTPLKSSPVPILIARTSSPDEHRVGQERRGMQPEPYHLHLSSDLRNMPLMVEGWLGAGAFDFPGPAPRDRPAGRPLRFLRPGSPTHASPACWSIPPTAYPPKCAIQGSLWVKTNILHLR